MALTKAEQEELSQLIELKRLEGVDQARQKGQREYDDSLMVQKLAYGVARPFQQMFYGIKDLFPYTDLTEEDKLHLEEIAGKQGIISTAGGLGGELATFAIPAAKLSQFVSKLSSSAPTLLAKSAPFLADLGFSVGLEGIKAPTEGKTRGQTMVDTATGYAATALGLKGLGAAKNTLRTSPEGRRMLEAGIPLTPSQASDSPIIEGVEEALGSLPFVSKNIRDMQNKSLSEWNNKLLNDVNPIKDNPITGQGGDAFKQVQGRFKEAYEDAYKGINREGIDFNRLDGMMNYAKNNASGNVGSNSVNPTIKAIKDAQSELNRFKVSGDTSAIEKADDILRKFSSDDSNASQLVKTVREEIKNSLGTSGQRLRDVDTNYAKYAILRDSATSTKDPLQSELIISPSNLTSGMKKSASPDQLARNEGFYQQEAQDATNTFGKTRPGNNLLRRALSGSGTLTASLIEPVSTALSLSSARALGSEPMRKAIVGSMGKLDKQKAIAEALRSSAFGGRGISQREINNILSRAGALSSTAEDTEGYILDEN